MSETHAAYNLSDAALGGPIRIQDGRLVDGYGRTLSLRGVNISGASKLPTKPNGLSHLTDGFFEHRSVTFVGRPFSLEDAPDHFRRLQAWGLTLVRLLVTWESLGHAGPNPNTDLDLDYIDYLRKFIELMAHYGLKCFICAHQDVWSRFSGGSGAPGWTFEAAGLDIEAFTATGAAYIHGQDVAKRAQGLVDKREICGPFVWPSGYQKLAASTMATLFWAGDALAPKLKCRRTPLTGEGPAEEVSIQNFLQDALIEAFGRLADAVGDLEACIGFEPINEPSRGLINLERFHGWNYNTDLHIGHFPSLIQSLALASGYAQKVDYYVKSWPFPTRVSHVSLVDPKGRSAWLPQSRSDSDVDRPTGMGGCIWQAHGVWKWDYQKQAPVVLQDDYFDYDHRPGCEGQKLEWYRDCFAPFVLKFAQRVSRNSSRHLSFVAPVPNEFIPPWQPLQDKKSAHAQDYATQTVITTDRPQNFIYAPHFYDLNLLFSKIHGFMSVNVQGLSRGMFVPNGLYFGSSGLHKNYKKQIRNIVRYGMKSLGRVPIIVGEVGLPFDINHRWALETGDFDKERELMDALISGMEDSMVGFTLWNYNPENRVEYGDGWNKEDFSIVNYDKAAADYRNKPYEDDKLYNGGRVLDVIIRPYAVKIAGQPIESHWNHQTLRYAFTWDSDPAVGITNDKSNLTEIFLPAYHYAAHRFNVIVTDGEWSYDTEKETLYLRHDIYRARHQVIVELCNVQKRLAQRVEQRRQAFPPSFPRSLVPLPVEIWLDTLSGGEKLMVLFMALIAVLALNIPRILM